MLTNKVRAFIAVTLLMPVAYIAMHFPLVSYVEPMSMQAYLGYNAVFPLLTAIIPAAIGHFFLFRKNKPVYALIMTAVAFCVGFFLTAVFGIELIPSGPFQDNLAFVEDLMSLWHIPAIYLIAVYCAGLIVRRS